MGKKYRKPHNWHSITSIPNGKRGGRRHGKTARVRQAKSESDDVLDSDQARLLQGSEREPNFLHAARGNKLQPKARATPLRPERVYVHRVLGRCPVRSEMRRVRGEQLWRATIQMQHMRTAALQLHVRRQTRQQVQVSELVRHNYKSLQFRCHASLVVLAASLLEVYLLALSGAESGAAGTGVYALLLVVLVAEFAQLAVMCLLGKRYARVHV